MHNYRTVRSMNLEEDLKSLGIDAEGTFALSKSTVNESIAGLVQPLGHQGRVEPEADDGELDLEALGVAEAEVTEDDDPIDGVQVTRELLNRILELPLDELGESDLTDLIDALAEKALPEGDEELAGLTEEVVAYLFERRGRRAKQIRGGKMIRTKRTGAKKRLQNKKNRRKASAKRAAKKLARKKAAGKISAGEKKTAKRQGKTMQDIKKLNKSLL